MRVACGAFFNALAPRIVEFRIGKEDEEGVSGGGLGCGCGRADNGGMSCAWYIIVGWEV